MRTHNSKHRRALVGTEVVVSLGLMMVIAALAVSAVIDYRHTRDHYTYRQVAAWAADAQLQRYRLGAPIDSRPPADLVPESITLETRVEPGVGQWQGFNRITVIATMKLPRDGQITEQIAGYIRGEVTP